MIRMSEPAFDRLADKQPVLADVVLSGREVDEFRRTGVYDLQRMRVHRERIRAASNTWGHQIRGNGGASPA